MKVEKIKVKEIQYTHCDYSSALQDSLIRIGISFPLRVRLCEDGYHCLDGHKRLSCIHDLLASGVHEKLQSVPVILEHHTRTAPPISLRNHH